MEKDVMHPDYKNNTWLVIGYKFRIPIQSLSENNLLYSCS